MHMELVGAYLPRLDREAMQAFVARQIDEFRLSCLDETTQGKALNDEREIEYRADEIVHDMLYELENGAYFEVLVTGNNIEFRVDEFMEPSTDQCGWCATILSENGQQILEEFGKAPASLHTFRAAFFIHEWPETGSLTAYGHELRSASFTSVPSRIWKLVPFCLAG